MDSTTLSGPINEALSNKGVKTAAFLLTGVFAGYTLSRVPKSAQHVFEHNIIVKFMVLLIMCLIAFPPDNDGAIVVYGVVAAMVLGLFELVRQNDDAILAKLKA